MLSLSFQSGDILIFRYFALSTVMKIRRLYVQLCSKIIRRPTRELIVAEWHVCVSKLVVTGSDHGMSIWPLGTNFSEILIEIHISSLKKMHLKMLSAICLSLICVVRNMSELPINPWRTGQLRIRDRNSSSICLSQSLPNGVMQSTGTAKNRIFFQK